MMKEILQRKNIILPHIILPLSSGSAVSGTPDHSEMRPAKVIGVRLP